jgi:hypothetical protein
MNILGRHHLIVLAGLIVLIPLAGLVPTLWTLAALVVSIGVHRLGKLLNPADRGSPVPHAETIILVLISASFLLAAGAAVLLFLQFGWLTAVAFVVLWLAFWISHQDVDDRAVRAVQVVRSDLLRLIGERASGVITEEQLATRAELILSRRLPELAHNRGYVAEVLINADGLTTDQHRRLLDVVERHANQVQPVEPPSQLQQAIRRAARP